MRRALLILLLLLAASAASAVPIELPRASEKWITLRVDEFTFVSNVSAAETTEIARDLLRMRDAIGRITHLRVRSSKPTRIFIFASERAFAPYREAIVQQKQENVGGIFTAADSGNFIVMKRDRSRDIDRTVYHELTHYFVRNTTAALPLWASEGIAEYYSTFRTAGDSVHIGRAIREHVQWLQLERLLPLRELLATTVDSPNYNERSKQGIFYAQSWALFHYLMDDDARRAQLAKYLKLLGQGQPVDDAFAAAFERPYAEVERELGAYVRGQTFVFTKYALSDLVVPDVPEPQPLTRETLLFELGHLLAHATPQPPADAQRMLEEVLALDPAHSGAHADLGRLHHVAGRRREADAAFTRAVELGSSDPVVHLLVGISAMERYQGIEDAGSRAAVLQARQAFERSAELDPRFARAWTGIGATYVASADDPAPGIAALEKSLALVPGDVNAAFNLVQLYAREGRRADAERLVDSVLARGATREILDLAREALLLTEVRQMEDLGQSGRTAEAAELARSIAGRTKDASLKAHLEGVIAHLDGVTSRNRSAEAINEAIAKANSGKLDEALAIVDGLLPEITDPAMLTEAKKLRAELASYAKKKR